MDTEKANDLWIKFWWKEIYEIKGKSGEHGTLGGSIRITESGNDHIIRARQITIPLKNKSAGKKKRHKDCSKPQRICLAN